MKTASILKFSMLLVLSSLVFSLAFLVLGVYFVLLSIDSWLTNYELTYLQVSCPSQEFAGVTTSYSE